MAIITYWQDPLTQKTMIPIYKKVMCNMILWKSVFCLLECLSKILKELFTFGWKRSYMKEEF